MFCRRGWFKGQRIKGNGLNDIAWFGPDGTEMNEENWKHDFVKSLAVYFNGKGIHTVGDYGEQIIDDDFYVIFNGHHETLAFKLPGKKYGVKWVSILDTYKGKANEEMQIYQANEIVEVKGRSVILLKQPMQKRRSNAV